MRGPGSPCRCRSPRWEGRLSVHKVEAVLVLQNVKTGEPRVNVEARDPERMVMVPKRGSLLVVVIRHCRGDEPRADPSRPVSPPDCVNHWSGKPSKIESLCPPCRWVTIGTITVGQRVAGRLGEVQ